MAYQPETATYDAGVFQLETTTPVQGGVGGASNAPLLNLADRTAYLKQHVDALEAASSGLAPINSPSFTGTPLAPTPALSDSSTKLANTSFVQQLLANITYKNVAGGVNVNLTALDCAAGVIVLQGAITANIQVNVPAATTRRWVFVNATSGGFTVTVVGPGGTGVQVAQGYTDLLFCDGTSVQSGRSSFISPTMFGFPTAPTQAANDSTTKLATTGFVFNAVNGLQSINCAGNSNVNVTAVQAGSGILMLTGALTGNITLLMPSVSGRWVILNNTTGGFAVTVQYAAGGSPLLLGTAGNLAVGDGTNFSSGSQRVAAAGAIAYTMGTVPLSGTVKANGTLLSRTTYSALWAYAQASGNLAASDGAWTSGQFSPGDGATTFRIPDLRGYHLRAFDDGRGVDSGRGIGSVQADQFALHSHSVIDPTHAHGNFISDPGHGHGVTDPGHVHSIPHADDSATSGGNISGNGNPNIDTSFTGNNVSNISIQGAATNLTVGINGASTGISLGSAGTGTETRVKNIAALACIYY